MLLPSQEHICNEEVLWGPQGKELCLRGFDITLQERGHVVSHHTSRGFLTHLQIVM